MIGEDGERSGKELRSLVSVVQAFSAFYARLRAGDLKRNALFAGGQSLVVTVCFFWVYRILVGLVGIERVGIWSLLLAGSALMRIGDVSGAGALSRYIAIAMGGRKRERASDYVHTVMLTSLGLNAALGLALYVVAPLALPSFIAPQYLAEAEKLVPYVVATMVLGALAVGVGSAIDGAQRADQRAVVVATAALVFLASTWLLVPRFGVVGYGAAQVVQQVVMLSLGWLVLRRHIPGLGWLPRFWRRDVFAETTGFALKLQGTGVMGMLFEPLAKFAFNHAGGPGLVVYYELASRLIVQVRSLVVAAATPLVPAFAAHEHTDQPAFKHLLERSTRAAIPAAVATAFVSLAGAPAISFIVLGTLQPDVLLMSAALTIGWAINVLGVPFYFAAQGQGLLRWNFASHALIALSVLVGALALSPVFGPFGLITAIVTGLLLSAITVLVGNGHALRANDILRCIRWPLATASLIIILLSAFGWAVYAVAYR